MCGDNGNDISDKEFLAACNRFGIDNPMPVMSQRLYFFGNNETAQSVLEAAYKKHNEAPFFDPEHFCGQIVAKEDKPGLSKIEIPDKNEKKGPIDMKETKVKKRELKKKAGAHDIRMLDKMENAHKFTSPPEAVLVRGLNIKIKDIVKDGPIK